MGTNFYWKEARNEDDDHIEQHIGKRSAAGLYCYDCGSTLNRGGTTFIHKGSVKDMVNTWLDTCPCCGKSREEGHFTKTEEVIRTGVATCCSFTWTVMKHKRAIEERVKTNPDKKIIVDEYGEVFSAREFLELLRICPIEFQSPCEFS